ncbi:MAG: c-type cytochrome [Deltaproteobacteria bacterium]|nr:c-type cytochrome [Deltaproteobacteria bacterium]
MRHTSLWIGISMMLLAPAVWADASDGQRIFQQSCAACHTVGEGKRLGPDLEGVTKTRDSAWLNRWIREPDKMIAEGDAIAVRLLNEYGRVPMPNLGLNAEQADAVIAFLASGSGAALPAAATGIAHPEPPTGEGRGSVQNTASIAFLAITAIIVLVFLYVARSTGNPMPVDVQKAYKLRRVFFISGLVIVVGLLATTLFTTPYPDAAGTPDRVVHVTTLQFNFVFTQEPVASAQDLQTAGRIGNLELPVGSTVEFRVTSLDTTHGFGIYSPQGAVYAQTQAMPGYTNRLRVKFSEPGVYSVLCMEYCGAAHHLMKTVFTVRNDDHA